MKVVDGAGKLTERDGVKFETFVFDALAQSPFSMTMEVERALEFSPVKNAEGSDSPESSRRDLCYLFSQFVLAKGLQLPPTRDGETRVEIDPLLAETEEEFIAADNPSPQTFDGGHLYEVGG